MRSPFRRFFTLILWGGLLLSLCACSLGDSRLTTQPLPTASAGSPVVSMASAEYVLGVDDNLKITVFNETDISGQFKISSTGTISMPLIGNINAAGLTVSQLQDSIEKSLAKGYLKNPRVGVEVLNYRPFFILGEVIKPGSYTYVNGMTVINAIALAGGYTYRAHKGDVDLKRGGPNALGARVGEETPVLPGDVINVRERFF